MIQITKKIISSILIVVAMFIGNMSGCNKKIPTASFPRIKGPPHQRLRWNREKYFTDAGVITLCKAIEVKDLKEIERLVKSGVDVNAMGRGNMTPLLWAFPMGEEVFKKMLELGADPNIKLTERAFLGILEKGNSVVSASVNFVDGPVHDQYLYDVNMNNYLQIVLNHGGDPNITDLDGDTPLFDAKKNPKTMTNKIHLLLKANADINHKNSQGRTPLMNGMTYLEYIVLLLKADADYRIVDNNGWDFILSLENQKIFREKEGPNIYNEWLDKGKCSLFDRLSKEGVDWKAARAALNNKNTMINLKYLPADYKHRPWLPQRPTLKNGAEKEEPSAFSLFSTMSGRADARLFPSRTTTTY
jgi:hypothetical protein